MYTDLKTPERCLCRSPSVFLVDVEEEFAQGYCRSKCNPCFLSIPPERNREGKSSDVSGV